MHNPADALKRDDLQAFFDLVIRAGESSWGLLQNLYVPMSDNQEIPASYNTAEVETSITVYLRGDVNRDGQVGIGDIVAITNVMAGDNSAGYDADVNDDDQVGIGDIVSVTNIMAGEE